MKKGALADMVMEIIGTIFFGLIIFLFFILFNIHSCGTKHSIEIESKANDMITAYDTFLALYKIDSNISMKYEINKKEYYRKLDFYELLNLLIGFRRYKEEMSSRNINNPKITIYVNNKEEEIDSEKDLCNLIIDQYKSRLEYPFSIDVDKSLKKLLFPSDIMTITKIEIFLNGKKVCFKTYDQAYKNTLFPKDEPKKASLYVKNDQDIIELRITFYDRSKYSYIEEVD